MRSSSSGRIVAIMLAVVAALLLQVTVLPPFTWQVGGLGLVPDLVLLVVVATALITDTRTGMLTGFAAGVLVDLAPPADHIAGRWALALAVVGYVVGRLAHDHETQAGELGRHEGDLRRPPILVLLAAAAGGSFLGTSIFALSGMLLDDGVAGVGDLLPVALAAVLLDVIAAMVVVPATLWLVRRLGAGPQARSAPWAAA